MSQPQNSTCNVLKALKQEIETSTLPDKEKLSQSIERLMELKHCDGRRR